MSPARIQRVHRIRSRIIAAAVSLFVALFGVIGVRLASGHDPGLAKSSATQGSTTSISQQPSQSVAPVTTSQS
jgi:hypothetical protein